MSQLADSRIDAPASATGWHGRAAAAWRRHGPWRIGLGLGGAGAALGAVLCWGTQQALDGPVPGALLAGAVVLPALFGLAAAYAVAGWLGAAGGARRDGLRFPANMEDALESIAEGLVLYDADDRIVLFNRVFASHYAELADFLRPGRSFEEMLRQAGARGLLPVPEAEIESFIRERLARHQRPDGMPILRRLADGRLLQITERPIRGGGIIAIGHDVSELMRRDTALQASEARQRALIENSSDIIAIFDVAGMIQYVSPSTTRLLGYPADELDGVGILTLVHPEDAPRAATALATGRETPGATSSQMILRVRHRDGGWRTFEVIGRNLTEHPAIGAIIVNARDVTDRAAAQRALQQSERQQRLVLDTMPAMVAHLDLDSRYRLVNAMAARSYGRPASEVVGRTVREVLSPRQAAVVEDAIARALAHGSVREERDVVLPDGVIRSVDVAYVPELDEDGRPRGVIAVAQDITRRKAAEAALRQAQKMEAVGQLTGGVAHDFNNLLGIVMGNLDLLAGQAALQPADRELLGRAIEAVARGAALTQRLLAFARRQTLQPRLIDVVSVVADLGKLLRATLGERIELAIVPAPGLWPCRLDLAQVEAAVVNLALNARDAMPEGGRLTIEVRNVVLRAGDASLETAPGDYVILAVTDTGHGMPPEVAERAFEPFFTTKEVGKGSGLGLSMVHGFAKQSGGHATIESAVGRGTTVRLYLPRATGVGWDAEPVAAAVERPAGDALDGAGRKILVVEDNAEMRAMTVTALRLLGFRVVEADNAANGLAALSANADVALLFSDVVLPGGTDGFALAAAARRARPDLKVIFATGFVDASALPPGAPADGLELLYKPFRLAELQQRLAKVLG